LPERQKNGRPVRGVPALTRKVTIHVNHHRQPQRAGHRDRRAHRPADPKFEDNIRDEVQLDKEFLASLREHGVIVPIIAVRDAEGRTLVREGQCRTFP